MIETHAHVYSSEFEGDLEDVINRAKSAGVEKILMPNVDLESIEAMHRVEDSFPDYCHSMLGLHPCSVKEDFKAQLKELATWLNKREYVAIGEIGGLGSMGGIKPAAPAPKAGVEVVNSIRDEETVAGD